MDRLKRTDRPRAYLPSQRPSRWFYPALVGLPLAVFFAIVFAPV